MQGSCESVWQCQWCWSICWSGKYVCKYMKFIKYSWDILQLKSIDVILNDKDDYDSDDCDDNDDYSDNCKLVCMFSIPYRGLSNLLTWDLNFHVKIFNSLLIA